MEEVKKLITSQGEYETLQSLRKKYGFHTENWCLYVRHRLSEDAKVIHEARLPFFPHLTRYFEDFLDY